MSSSYSQFIRILLISIAVLIYYSKAEDNFLNTASSTGNQKPSERFIVTLNREYSHEHFEQFFHKLLLENNQEPMQVHYRYSHLIYGLTVSGINEQDIMKHPGVVFVEDDQIIHLDPVIGTSASYTSTPVRSWGLDRIDQFDLPLNNEYNFVYDGTGVDIYIVDSGIDTNHIDFSSTSANTRVVQNIWDNGNETPEADNDRDGHGSHVAGTAGGNTAGVSPGANVYGVKVFEDDGAPTSTIVAALEFIYTRQQTTGRPSVINMSLGGECAGGSVCGRDALSAATNAIVNKGFVVVVAAGNDYVNACYFTPAAATLAITVASSNITDGFSSFSNYGSCVDIIAPGSSINSVCSFGTLDRNTYSYCNSETRFKFLDGTSMASPHVAGVAAQILQAKPLATPANVAFTLQCLSAKSKIRRTPTSTTVNYLLEIPKVVDECFDFTPPTAMPVRKFDRPTSPNGARRDAGSPIFVVSVSMIAATAIFVSVI